MNANPQTSRPRLLGLLAACLGLLLAAMPLSFLLLSRDSSSSEDETLPSRPGPFFFQDETAESGVEFTYRNGEEAGHYAILEALGGGVALFDYDGDGRLDIFVTGGGYFAGPGNKTIKGHGCRLYKNLGHFQFKDVTDEAGLGQLRFYTHGCAVADFNKDGWPDLLVTGWGRLALFQNVSNGAGGRTFVEVTRAAGLNDRSWSTSAAWGDLDGDGYPDLYVCHYVDWSLDKNHKRCLGFDGKRRDVCPPADFGALPHVLYRNNGNGTFTDVSKEAGLRVDHPHQDYGKGLGVLMVDVNGDGKPDIYVANDMTDKFLYINHSRRGQLRFQEVGEESGTARDGDGAPNGSMGLAAADYDGCGRPSLWVTNYENELHALYRNDCTKDRPFFRFATRVAGIGAIGQSYVGWGTGFLDLDHDGWEDLVFVNGHPNHYPRGDATRRQRPVLLRNGGQGRFEDITAQGGPYFQAVHNARGLALGDLDNDGHTDLVISHVNEPLVLLRNRAVTRNHWLGVSLAGADHRDVVGAKVTLEANGRRLTRFAQGGGSYASSNDPRLLFGLGPSRRVGRLTVAWPCGAVQNWDGLECDRYWRLVEGKRSALDLRRPGRRQ
jgi:hypothetical protein